MNSKLSNLISQGLQYFAASGRTAPRTPEGPTHPADRPVQLEALEDRILFDASPLGLLADANISDLGSDEQFVLPELTPIDQQFETLESLLAEIDLGSMALVEANQEPLLLEESMLAEADPESGPVDSSSQLIVIDGGVENIEQLIQHFTQQAQQVSNIEILVIGQNENGVEKISEYLGSSEYTYEALHVISHGTGGTVRLGSVDLTLDNLAEYQQEIRDWSQGLSSTADILLYGCEIAGTQEGQQLVAQISEWSSSDVAASENLTGHASLGGDWTLEYVVGNVSTEVAFGYAVQSSWFGTLDITSGLVLQNTFDANANDSSGSNYHGTQFNGALINTTSVTNNIGPGKLFLDGTNDYVDFSAHATNFQGLTQGTISAWVYANSDRDVIFELSDSSDANSRLALFRDADGSFDVFIREGTTTYMDVATAAGAIAANTWTHVAVTVDASGNKLYVNGVQQGGLTYAVGSATTNVFFDDVADLDFAAWGVDKYSGSSFTRYFNGMLDDGRVYNRALTAGDITELSDYTGLAATSTISVTNTLDNLSGNTLSFAQLIADNGGDGISLREAIAAANNQSGLDTINFNIAAALIGGTHTINVSTALPTIGDAVIFNGLSEPDYVSGTPVVRIDGAAAGFSGISIGAGGGGSTIQGLMITGFTLDGINVASGANNVIIADNWIGTAGTGTSGHGNANVGNSDDGIDIAGSNALMLRNVINNNYDEGIDIVGSGVTGHVIQGNYIGLDPDGSTSVTGNRDVGIAIISGTGNTIGGTSVAARNVISMNWDGLEINTSGNVVQGNYIGTDVTGTLNLGNRLGSGVLMPSAASNNQIGGTTAGAGNLIAYNALNAVKITNGSGVAILGNTIFSNVGLGIDLGTAGVTANDSNDTDTGANNLQNFPALTSATAAAAGTTIVGSLNSNANTTFRIEFYANRPSIADASNGEGERYLGFATVTTDGSGNATINTTLTNVWINAGDQVSATATVDLGGGSYSSTSEFGANITATSTGIVVVDTISDISDGTTTSITNLGNARGADGRISLREAMAATNATAGTDKIVFNIAGTGIRTITIGATALPNITGTVIIDGWTNPDYAGAPVIELNGNNAGTGNEGFKLVAGSTGSTIRGFIINRFTGNGIEIDSSNNHVIEGNWIGLSNTGLAASASEDNGIMVTNSTGLLIGGTTGASRNVISGNSKFGIVFDNADNSTISGNYIGTDFLGTGDVNGTGSNGLQSGIVISNGSSGNVVGGTTPGARNVISGNNSFGLEIQNAGTDNNLVYGNYIGTTLNGIAALSNASGGIYVWGGAANNSIGSDSAGAGNVIAYNAGNGVDIASGINNAIVRNSIYSNSLQGINLGTAGVTANDSGDGDSGANNLQNFPVLTSAVTTGTQITITGTFNSAASTSYRIEFYSNSTGDGTGYGEGQTLIGLEDTTTDAFGNATFSATFTAAVSAGSAISATVSRLDGADAAIETSEFAQNVIATSMSVNTAPTYSSGDGLVTTNFGAGSVDFVYSTAIQPDGKILAAGYTTTAGNNDFALVRYNIDGSLDTSFGGGDGMVSTAVGAGSDAANGMTVLSNGKILLVGNAVIAGSNQIALVQYNTDGSLDTSFGGGDGIAISGIVGSDGNSVAVQADGKIVVGGTANFNNFLIARFNSDGTLDTGFGTSGSTSVDFNSGNDIGYSVAIQSDGKLVMSGRAFSGSSFDFALARFTTTGTLDTTFDGDGKVLTDIGTTSSDAGYRLTLQSDGKIVVAGWSDAAGTTDFALARYNTNGSLDTSFSGDGKLTTAIGSGGDLGQAVTVQSDGKIIVAGQSSSASNNFGVVRYLADGTLDTTFNGTGIIDQNFGGSSDDRANGVLVQSDGKILVAGTSTLGGTYDFAIARYTTTGALDTRLDLANTLNGTPTFTEGGSAVVLDSNVTIFDAELSSSNNFSGATLTLVRSGGARAQDVYSSTGTLSALSQGSSLIVGGTTIGTVTTNSSGTLVLTFNANATNALVNQAMQQIAYSNSSDAPPASAQINWTFNDNNSGAQGTGGALTAAGNTVVTITATNDQAAFTSLDGTPTYTEGGSPVLLDSNVTIFDAELSASNNFNGATLTLVRSGGANSQDVFSASGTLSSISPASGNVVVGGTTIGTYTNAGGTLVLTFNANATNALVNSAMQQISYSNSSNAPPASAQINWTFNDNNSGAQGTGGALTANGSITVAITAIMDGPVNTVPGAQNTSEEVNLVFSSGNGNQILVSDADAGSNPIEVTLSVTNGTMTLAGTTGLTFVNGDGATDSTMTVRGTVANINIALNGLTFTPTSDYNGGATLTIRSLDSSLVSQNIDAALLGRYDFENPVALGTDTSPATGNAGSVSGATAIVDGTRGNALSLDGNDYVQFTGHFGDPADVTLAAWVNLTTADTNGSDVINLGEGIVLRLDDAGALRGYTFNGSIWVPLTYVGNLAGTGWHHVAYSVSDTGNVQTLYLDGIAVASASYTDSINYSSAANSFIGRHASGSTNYDFTGKIDDARVYSRALTAGEIATLASDLALRDTDSVAITVTAVNDAPMLDGSGVMSLTTITEDDTSNSGNTIAQIIASAGGDRITDVDSGAVEGIALFFVTGGNGTWQYNTGSGWTDVGTVASSSALLLRATDSLRYLPGGLNSDTGTILFQAWDQTSGTFGTKVDTSINGTTTAFSVSVEVASITVTAVNDAPTAVLDTATAVEAGGVSNGTVGTNPTGNVLTNDTDVDSGDTKTVSGVAAGVVGSASTNVGLAVTGSFGSINIAANGSYTYTVDNSNATVQALRTSGNTITDVFTYTMRDTAGLTSTTQITVTIQGANDTPQDLATTGLTVSENAANTTSVGIITRSDLDASDTPSYSLVDSAGGRFAINSSTGAVTVANGSLLNFESATSHNVTVRVTDLAGATYDELFTVNLTDVDEFDVSAPVDSNATANAVNENVSIGTAVGITAAASDADATTNAVTYSLFNSDAGNFSIDANTGIVTTAAALNRETLGASRNITVRATSADGSTADTVFTININDLDEFDTGAVTDSNATANSVAENAANGTVVGITGLASDADATTNTITYSLDNSAGGKFAIDANTGIVTVNAALDYETAISHSIIVRATSADGSFSTQSFTINVTDVSEGAISAVSDSNAAANTVLENSSNGTTVGVTGLATDPDITDVVTYSLDNDAGGQFAINGTTGIVTVNGAIDREAAASYNIIIRATSSDTTSTSQSFTINIGDVDEFNVGAVTDINVTGNSVVENAAINTVVNITGLASDADATTNTITYSLFDNDGGRFAIDANTGIVTVAGAINREVDGASRNITIRATSSDTSFTDQVFSITIVDVNEFAVSNPTDINAAANAVDENVAIGTVVGISAAASDADATTNGVTYSLFNNDGGNFAIDANTGVVTTAALLNRETLGASRNITVRATSADGSTADIIFAISINDLDEFDVTNPVDVNATANAVNENAANGTTVGVTASASDVDATTSTVTYSLTDSAGGRFAIDANTGVVTVADGTLLDREAAVSHSITVRATSADGTVANTVFTINLNDLDEFDVTAPVDTHLSLNSIFENSPSGATVSVIAQATDGDATNNTLTYSLTDSAGGRFQISAVSGVVSILDGTLLDREAAAAYNITVRATSSDGSTADSVFTVNLIDVDEFDVSTPLDTNAAANSVIENAANGTAVGVTADASDSDATNNTVTYSLFDNAGGRFAIDANTGVVTVADGTLLNREAVASHNITVRATSSDGSTADSVFTINLNDVDEFDISSVTDSNAVANTVAENAANGTVVGVTGFASDADATTNAITYTLDDNAGGRFAIDGSTGVVTVADGSLLDYETATSHNFTVRATSADGSFSTQAFTISVTNANEGGVGAVSDSNAAVNYVLENASNGTAVGVTGQAIDSDVTDTVSYSLDDNAGGRFAIDANTGIVTVNSGLDREAAASYNITIRATSTDTSTTTQSFTINIGDVDEFDVTAPSDTNATANAVDENAANGTVVGVTANASDSDATNNTITYSLTSNPDGLFQIDVNTGVVTTAAAIDRETHGALRSITVQAASSDGSTQTQSFNIAVNDLDEFNVTVPTDVNASSNSVAENATIGTTVGITAFAEDLDSTNNMIVYTLDDNAGGLFAIDGVTGVVTVNGTLDYETATSHNIVVRASSSDGSSNTQSFTINVTDVNESGVTPISDTDAAADFVLENISVGTVVGLTAFADDLDVTDTVSYSLDDNAGGLFSIDAATGVVTVAGAIDREAAASYNITVRATSTDSSTITRVFTIAIGDVDEFNVSVPTDNNAAANAVNENVVVGTTVGLTANAFDLDATNNTITYSLTSNPDGLFQIDSVTGLVTTAATIDRETHGATRSITVQASSSDGSTATENFTIAINDLNESFVSLPTDINGSANVIDENVAIGTTVGITANAIDGDATNNTITYSLTSNPDGLFQIDVNTGVITTAAAVDREAHGASRSITVQATSSDGTTGTSNFTITINDLNEFSVSTPTDSNVAANEVNENVAIGTAVGITANAFDLDATNNTITYSLTSNPGGLFQIDVNTGVVTTAAAIDRETHGALRSITVQAASSDGSTATQSFAISINDLNEFAVGTVVDSNAAANSVAENASVGTTLGITALASDADATNNSITYTLDDSASGRFAIDANTGVVTVNAALDYETNTSHSISVRATSADGSFSLQAFTINVADANEGAVGPVADNNVAANYVLENSANGTAVGITGLATDPDGTDAVSYSLDDTAGGRFTIDANTGVVTVNGAIDREAAASYNITVRATSSDTTFSIQTFTINIGDVNEFATSPVTDSNPSANSVVENSAIGTVVNITGLAIDADATTNAITYSLVDNDGGRFAIDSNTGVVTVSGAINREADGASRNITIRATSADSSFSEQTFSIAIIDANEFTVIAPTDTNATANAIDENAAIGTVVGVTANSVDNDATNNTVTYGLVDSDSGNFAIDANTGVVTTAATLNRETLGASRNITVRATSADGSTADTVFTIAINDLDEFNVGPVADSNAAANLVAENTTIGTAVGITALASDADATNNTITYTLDDNAGGRFVIDSATGVVTVAGSLDHELSTSHNIVIRATSQDGSFSTQTFVVNVTDVNETPIGSITDTDFASDFVAENSVIGTTVGLMAFADDADGTDVVTYSLDNNAGGLFSIDGVSGRVTVAGAIDREAIGSSAAITVRATSTDGSFVNRAFIITIGDVNEMAVSSPVDTNLALNSVNEDATSGTLVGLTAFAIDGDATSNAITYSLIDDAGGRFVVDAATGVVSVAAGSPGMDFETANQHQITVRASSSDGSIADANFTIFVNDVNDEQVLVNNLPLALNQGLTATIDNSLLLTTDPDNISGQLEYTVTTAPANGGLLLNGVPTNRFTQADIDAGRVTYRHDGGLSTLDQFTFSVDDGQGAATTGQFNIFIATTNVAPVGVDDRYVMVAGTSLTSGSGLGGLIGNDSDSNNDLLAAQLITGPSNGRLLLNSDGTFDYTPGSGFVGIDQFFYVAFDGLQRSNLVTVTIEVQGTVLPPDPEITGDEDETDPIDEDNSNPGDDSEPENEDNGDENSNDDDNSNFSQESLDGVAGLASNGVNGVGVFKRQDESTISATEHQAWRAVRDQAEKENAESILRQQSEYWQNGRQIRALEQTNAEYLALMAIEQTNNLMYRELEKLDNNKDNFGSVEFSVSVASTLGTLGYLLWSLRGGALLTAAMSQTPSWRFIDPLPVLDQYTSRKKEHEADDFENMFL